MAYHGWAVFLIICFVAVVALFVGWIVQRQLRARRLGLPAPSLNPFTSSNRGGGGGSGYNPPAPAPGGVTGWVRSKIDALRNTRTSAGAYEATSLGQRRRGGFDPLDPDEAWDTRVGNEADYGVPGSRAGPYTSYDEQETGLRDPGSGPYGGGGYGEERSRSRQRELDQRYDEETGRAPKANPFGDGAERNELRGVSPRPVEGHDRRSAFREDM